MSQIIDEAVADYERQVFWRAFEQGYERLADDPPARSEVEAERRGEASSLTDDLE